MFTAPEENPPILSKKRIITFQPAQRKKRANLALYATVWRQLTQATLATGAPSESSLPAIAVKRAAADSSGGAEVAEIM